MPQDHDMLEFETLQVIKDARRSGAIKLNLSGQGLTELPAEIGTLTNLEILYLHNNLLQALPAELQNLSQLRELGLSGNKFSSFPGVIGTLKRLERLSLSRNSLVSVSSEIEHLRNLRKLTLYNNQLTELSDQIGALDSLEILDLHTNQLSNLPSTIGQLTSLRVLDLRFNNIDLLPPELGALASLQDVAFMGNPLKSLPPEIVDQGATAILIYLREQLEARQRQWVSKVLLVGQGGVGKTSLLRALRNEPFDVQESTTRGVDIVPLTLPHPSEDEVEMTLKAWDFGGQEIYHATHQFFLTNRSLFLLVWNSRHEWEQGKLIYWLDTIQARAPESPVLIVATHTDERDARLPLRDLKRQYPQIAGSYAVSNKEGSGIGLLRERIKEVASELPLMGEVWPTSWLKAATDIRSSHRRWITPSELFAIFERHNVLGKQARILGTWLHELGDILFFQDDVELDTIVILEPQWVTAHISKVLESEEVSEQFGVLTRRHMKRLWADLSPSLHGHFLRLMERYDLSYRIPDDPRDRSLIVERLPLDEPSDLTEKWNSIAQREPYQELRMKFKLNTIPPGVPTWFIARQHRFTTYTHWRTGVLFAQDSRDPFAAQHLALVRTWNHERMVELAVRSPFPHNFFTLLKDGLELTLNRFPGLQVERLVPCPTSTCSHEFSYEDLQRRLLQKPVIECPKCWKDISVPQLLFGLDWQTQDAVLKRLDEVGESLRRGQEQLLVEQRELRTLTQREFLAVFKREQSFIESHCPNVFLLYSLDQKWYRKPLARQKLALHLCCQAPNEWHYTYGSSGRTGYYEFEAPAEWLVKLAPYLRALYRLLQLATPFLHDGFGVSRADIEQEWDHHVDLMSDLLQHIPELDRDGVEEMEGLYRIEDERLAGPRYEAEGAALRQIRSLLDDQDPAQEWGGLRKVLTPEGHYLWLCEYHAAQYRP